MTSREFQDKLRRRLHRVGLTVSADTAAKLEAYYRLLSVWNKKINLAGFPLEDAPPDALDRLLVEPLVAARTLPAGVEKMMDVGSGGGSPAIPLALMIPTARLLMVESKTRKSVFLREAIRTLSLSTAEVATARLEELLSRPDLHEAHDLVTVRAVRIEMRSLVAIQAFVKPRGQVFLFRSSAAVDPSAVVPPPLTWKATYPLIETLRSRLVVLEKLPVAARVPRGT